MAGTSHVVTATVLYTLDKDGNRVPHLRGENVSGLSSEDVARFKACGAIASPSNAAATEAKGHPAEPDYAATSLGDVTTAERHDPDPSASEIVAASNSGTVPAALKPPKAGTKESWVTYAVASGQLTEDEAKEKTRDELRDELK